MLRRTGDVGRVPAPLLVLGSIVSVQFGAALAVTLLPLVGVAGSVALRLGLATVLMWPFVRPSLRGRSRADWYAAAAYGATLAAMNLAFYGSLRRLPIGVAVTIEFLGPLVLSAVMSRHVRDFLAVLLAAGGVVLASGAATTPLGDLDKTGILLALAAGVGWATYILTSQHAGRHFAGVDGLVIAMLLASVVLIPLGSFEAGTTLFSGQALLKGAGVGVLSAALPFSLELVALRRLVPNVFGILLSLEPAVAAAAGFVVLGQRLSPVKLVGMLCVVAASVLILGAARHGAEDQPPARDV